MRKRSAFSAIFAVAIMASVVLSFSPSHAAVACTPGTGFHSDAVNEPIPGSDGSAADYLDIKSWKLCATSDTTAPGGGYLTGTILTDAPLPTGDQLPAQAGDTGYSFNMFFASGGTTTSILPANDGTALMHKRQRTGLLQEGERYGYQGPFPIGDSWQWSLELEWRYNLNPSGPDWDVVYAFTRWNPAQSLTFTELLTVDNPKLSASVVTTATQSTITIQLPYQIKWRAAKTKGQGAGVGGTTYHQHSMLITDNGHRVSNAWAVSWSNATTSLPEAVCAVTQPAAGLCGIGGVISQNDQAPDNSGILGQYGFTSYTQTEKCPQYVATPIAAGPQPGGEFYRQVNPAANSPDWKPCYFHLPESRSFLATNLGFIAP